MRIRMVMVSSAMLLLAACAREDKITAPRPNMQQCGEDCGGGGGGGGGGQNPPANPPALQINGNPIIPFPGSCNSMSVFASGGNGTEGTQVIWTISDNRVARFDNSTNSGSNKDTTTTTGFTTVCGARSGSTFNYGYFTLTAQWATATQSVDMEHAQNSNGYQPTVLDVQPISSTILKGTYIQLNAIASDAFGHSRVKTSNAGWTTNNSAIASVLTGAVSGNGPGTAGINATYNGTISSTASVKVRAVATVSVTSPSGLGGVLVGYTLQLHANAVDQDGAGITWPISWTTSAPSVATVDGTGKVTGVSEGTVTITATADGKQGTFVVNVFPEPVLTSVASDPSPALQYQPFSITVTGSHFAPTDSILVVIEGQALTNCFIQSSIPCPTYVGTFSTRTSTLLVSQNWVYSGYGPYHVYVWDVTTGGKSNFIPFQINPLYP